MGAGDSHFGGSPGTGSQGVGQAAMHCTLPAALQFMQAECRQRLSCLLPATGRSCCPNQPLVPVCPSCQLERGGTEPGSHGGERRGRGTGKRFRGIPRHWSSPPGPRRGGGHEGTWSRGRHGDGFTPEKPTEAMGGEGGMLLFEGETGWGIALPAGQLPAHRAPQDGDTRAGGRQSHP